MKRMKQSFFAALLACALCAIGTGALVPVRAWADVKIDAKNFPDENFRNWVKENAAGGGDVLTDIASVQTLSIGPKGISSLKGIEFFTDLWRLQISGNAIATLDLSKNTALEWLECPGNGLTELVLPRTDMLKMIFCRENHLTKLDLSGNPGLNTLQCYKNRLTALDLSHNPALETLICSQNELTELDLSVIPKLELLQCHENRLTALDLSHNPALVRLDCPRNRLTELDLSHNPALLRLDCSENALTALDLSKKPALEDVYCESNQIAELDLAHSPALKLLFCSDNKLTELDLSHAPTLEELYCIINRLTTLDLSHNPALKELSCGENEMTKLVLPNDPALEYLSCGANPIEALDLSHAAALKRFHGYFEEIDLSKNPRISELDLSNMTRRVTLPNGDRVDLGKILRLPREDGGDYRLDISGYDGKIEQVLITKWGEDDATPLDVPGGACTFKPVDGTMTLLYRIGGEAGTLRILMGIVSEPGFEADEGTSSGEQEQARPAAGTDTGDVGDEEEEDEEDEEVAEEVVRLSVTLANKTDAMISVALARQSNDGGDAFSKGWFNVKPGEERNIPFGNFKSSSDFGFYALSGGGKRVWTARPDDPKYAGSFWIHPKKAFESRDGEPIEGGKEVGFRRLKVSSEGKATLNFTVKK